MTTYTIVRLADGVRLFASVENDTGRASAEITPEASRRFYPRSYGFEFGYAGSGPAQLAAALLFDVFDGLAPDAGALALDHLDAFMREFIVPQDWEADGITKKQGFELSSVDILRWFASRVNGAVQRC